MKDKLKNIFTKKSALLVCQETTDGFKLLRFAPGRKEITGIETGVAASEFGRYQGARIVFCLPRQKVTFRLLKKVPAQSPKEIESIVSLQAPRCLPYPAEELISGYQVISLDKQGYSELNMAVAHKETIERCLEAAKTSAGNALFAAASPWGLLSYYRYLKPRDHQVTILIDADASGAELVVVREDKLLYSRAFRVERSAAGWQQDFIDEINKSRAAYSKEAAGAEPVKIVLLGAEQARKDFAQALAKQAGLPVSELSYEGFNFSAPQAEKIRSAEVSFAALIGLALKPGPESLSLLPPKIKEANRKLAGKKEWLRLGVSLCAIAVIIGLGMARTLENKAAYLSRLKAELAKIAEEARPLEEIEKRIKIAQGRLQGSVSGLEALRELYRVLPPQVLLASFAYEEASRVVIRGQSPELKPVFDLAQELEKSPAFSGYSVKVNYATKKATATGEAVDFQIDCLREK